MKISTPTVRTSARQAAARQRIQQIDDPAGSAPPFEPTRVPSWVFNPGRQEERRLLEAMILHLQSSRTNDASVLQFIFMDWPLLATSMNTKATVTKVKKTLLRLEVDFIHRTDDNYWGFWNDYTIEGIFDIYPPPTLLTLQLKLRQ